MLTPSVAHRLGTALTGRYRIERELGAGGMATVYLAGCDAHITFHLAEVYAMAGEVERGLDLVALGIRRGFTPMPFIATHCPLIAPLRGHPRFAELVADGERRSAAVRASVPAQTG